MPRLIRRTPRPAETPSRDVRAKFANRLGRFGWALALAATTTTTLAGASPTAAQIVFDDTFGAPGPAPTENGGATLVIEQSRGGLVAGGGRTHLFHSFDTFNVGTGETAEFRTDDLVDVVFSRITGGAPSTIGGDLRVRSATGLGTPDLLLLNPNGVLFGGSARLDLRGAFLATTAEAVGFEDGALFTAAPTSPVPSTAAPLAFARFPTLAAPGSGLGDIELSGSLISNEAGGALAAEGVTLLGRNIRTTGAGLLAAVGSTVQLGALGEGAADVPVAEVAGRGFDLSGASSLGTNALEGAILIGGGDGVPFNLTTRGPDPDQGRIVIRAGRLTLAEGGLIAGGDGQGEAAAAPTLDVELGDELHISGSAGKIEALYTGAGAPGALRIATDQLTIENRGSLESTTAGDGVTPGALSVDARAVEVSGEFSQIKSTNLGSGAGAEIQIRAERIALPGGASTNQIASQTRGSGTGGDILLEAQEIVLGGGARVLSDSSVGADGAPGAIQIHAEEFDLSDRADVLTVTNGAGPAGDLTVHADRLSARNNVRLESGSNSLASSGDVHLVVRELELDEGSALGTGPIPRDAGDEAFDGPAGAVTIEADRIALRGGSQITSTTDGAGNAGDLDITVQDTFTIEGLAPGQNQPSGVFARSGLAFGSSASGDGGALRIRAGRLEVRDGAEISAQSFGTGRAGEVDLRVDRELLVEGGRLSTEATDVGITGDLRIETGSDLTLERGGTIASTAPTPRTGLDAPGDPPTAGDVELRVGGQLVLRDATITTDSARPESGSVRITTAGTTALLGSAVTTNVDSASGSGGDIRLDTQALALSESRISANAAGLNADAGNIAVRAEAGLVISPTSVIEARAERGVSGQVLIAGPDTNLAGELGSLAVEYQSDRETLRDPCSARRARVGSFTTRPQRDDVSERDACPLH